MAKTAFPRATPQQQLVLGVPATKCLNKFADYLLRVKSVAPGTRKIYCFWVRRFLAGSCGPAAPDWSALRADATLAPRGIATAVSASVTLSPQCRRCARR
jgi:hypothetical protein